MYRRLFTRLLVVAATLSPATPMSAQPRPRPAPAPAPAPTPAPARASRAPLSPVEPLARLEALAPMLAVDVMDVVGQAGAIAELARAEAMSAIDHAELTRSVQSMSADLARLSTVEATALALEGQAIAATAPLARLDGMVWSGASAPRGYRTSAPEPWDAQDPADSLYREARKALTSDAYQRAAELFKQIRQKYPKSSYAPDAPYWEAFALQRLGGQQNLYLAQDALGLQQRDYPRAATRGDAAALNSRIEAQLGRRGNVAAAQSVMGRAERAANDGCPRAEEDERVDALNAVTQMDAERAMPILKKVLARREPCTQQLRRTAVWLVARQKSPEAASLLVNSAKTDPDREVREQAVFWLANVPSEEAVSMLIDLARTGDDIELRKRAVYALSRAKSEKAVATLREITADDRVPEDLRAEALNWYLNRTGRDASDALGYLKDVYSKANGTQLKQITLRYIAGLNSDDSRNWLVALATNDREPLDVRRTAVSYLSNGGGGYSYWTSRTPVARTTGAVAVSVNTAYANDASARPTAAVIVGTLWRVWEKTDELEIRRQVLSSLANVRDNAGTDKLIDVARNEKNTELRRSAISYLSRSKDPRAIELLQEIINK